MKILCAIAWLFAAFQVSVAQEMKHHAPSGGQAHIRTAAELSETKHIRIKHPRTSHTEALHGSIGDPCEWDHDCNTNVCAHGVCTNGDAGDPCEFDEHCTNRRCIDAICRAGDFDDPCAWGSYCNSNICSSWGTCTNGVTGDPCEIDGDCRSHSCVEDICQDSEISGLRKRV